LIPVTEKLVSDPPLDRFQTGHPIGQIRNQTRVGVEERSSDNQTTLLGFSEDGRLGRTKHTLRILIARMLHETVDCIEQLTPGPGVSRWYKRPRDDDED
jgi:hypothetical protein